MTTDNPTPFSQYQDVETEFHKCEKMVEDIEAIYHQVFGTDQEDQVTWRYESAQEWENHARLYRKEDDLKSLIRMQANLGRLLTSCQQHLKIISSFKRKMIKHQGVPWWGNNKRDVWIPEGVDLDQPGYGNVDFVWTTTSSAVQAFYSESISAFGEEHSVKEPVSEFLNSLPTLVWYDEEHKGHPQLYVRVLRCCGGRWSVDPLKGEDKPNQE